MARFRRDVERLIGRDAHRIGVAVSGGPDSLALLLLAHAAFPGSVFAATVDHRLRSASADEAAMVAELCRTLGVPHATLPLDWPDPPGSNLQARARDGRYLALLNWALTAGVSSVLTGHHSDDQAETLLMRMVRGAGLPGLSGVRPTGLLGTRGGDSVTVARPLLGWRKAELVALVRSAELRPVDDPSNHDDRFDRTRARALLADTDWLSAERLAASAEHLRQSEEALSWCSRHLFRERASDVPLGFTLNAADLPEEIQRRLVVEVFRLLTGDEPRGPSVARLLASLEAGRTATLAGIKALPDKGLWTFTPAPPRRTG